MRVYRDARRSRLALAQLRHSARHLSRVPPAPTYRPPPTWNALQKIKVGQKFTEDGEVTLDGSLDLVAYQLFRDGLLPQTHIAGRTLPVVVPEGLSAQTHRRLERERDAAVAAMKRSGVRLRRSMKETAITIGCDEAGRGPLAGPVVGAAVCRIPMSSFNNEFQQLYHAREQFRIADSKSISKQNRDTVFAMVTGYANFTDIASMKKFSVHHCRRDAAPEGSVATCKRFQSHQKLARLPFKKLLSMQTPFLVSYHGHNSAGNYLYFWSVGIANHSYVDQVNIYVASMNTMHRSALNIWHTLNDARFSTEVAPRPRHSSISQYLFTRFCTAANHDGEKRYAVPEHLELMRGASDYFDFEPIQPPLVLVDGHAVPEPSYNVFTDVKVGGAVHPLVEGDKRSLSIAAASCLAKVTRDEIMEHLDKLYPLYRLGENKGYPVEQHMRCVARHGLSPVHRRTFRPCKEAAERQQRRLLREQGK